MDLAHSAQKKKWTDTMVFDLAAKDADEMLWDPFLDPFRHTAPSLCPPPPPTFCPTPPTAEPLAPTLPLAPPAAEPPAVPPPVVPREAAQPHLMAVAATKLRELMRATLRWCWQGVGGGNAGP